MIKPIKTVFANLPLAQKLTLICLLTSALAVLVAGLGFIVYDQAAFKKDMVRNLTITAGIVGFNSTSALSFDDEDSARETLKGLAVQPHLIAACIYARDGTVFASYHRDGQAGTFAFPSAPPDDLTATFSDDHLDVYRRIVFGRESVGTVYLQSDLGELGLRLRRYGLIVGMMIVLSLIAAYALASRLQAVISAPVTELAVVAARVGKEKNYSLRASRRGGGEVGRLIDGFNGMLAQIQARDLELQKGRNELEQRVEARTAELRKEVADRETAQEALRLVGSAVEQSRESIMITRAEVDLPGPQIVFVNPAFTQMTGYRSEDALGKTPRLLQGPRTDRSVLDRLRHNLTSGEPFEGEAINYRKDGTEFPVEWQVAPIRDASGLITHFLSIQRDITERKKAEESIEETHRQLLATSRQAGMAEVATGVLHNVGNVLNSVNVSATLVADQLRHSKAANLARVCALLDQHSTDLAEFLTADPKGKIIPIYLGTLVEEIAKERIKVTAELDDLRKNIEHIKDIVAMQQSYAKNSGFTETISLPDLIEDALRINAGSLARHAIDLVRDYQARPVMNLDKHKVMQILINLVRNAKYACDESGRGGKLITVRTTSVADRVRIQIIDNGVGIPPENLTRIFAHGFTTRKTGHGFGLHSGAIAARELGGSLRGESAGINCGATFTLELPHSADDSAHAQPTT